MTRSIQLREQFIVTRPIADVFYYLADFSTISEWDASVISAKKVSEGAITQGTRFDLVLRSAGRRVPMAYTLTTYQALSHLVFTGKAQGFVAIDSIWLKETPQGTEITWQADITFEGILAHLLPVMRPSLLKLAKTSMQGLAHALSNNYHPQSHIAHTLSSKLILPELFHFSKYGYLHAQKNWQPMSANMHGKHVLITGASSGIGLAAAYALAAKGCHLTLVLRNAQKGQQVVQDLMRVTGNTSIDIEIADMSIMTDVIALSQRLLNKQHPIDVLINNAGALFNPRQETHEGLEQSFALLLLSPFILTTQIKPLLSKGSRVVNVLSGGMYSQGIVVDDLENKQGTYSGSVAYAKAKRGLMIVTEQWAKLWQADGISVHAMHPGWADTAGVVTALPEFYKLTKPILRTPEQGADTIVWLACATEVTKSTGLFWLDRSARPTHLSAKTQETQQQREQLWLSLLKYQQRFMAVSQ